MVSLFLIKQNRTKQLILRPEYSSPPLSLPLSSQPKRKLFPVYQVLTGCLFFLAFLALSQVNPPLYAQAPPPGRVYFDLGEFAFAEQDYVLAEKKFQLALKKEPDNALYLQALGRLYLRQGNTAQAVHYLQRSYDIDPDLPRLGLELAQAYLKSRQHSKAGQVLQQYLQQHPKSGTGYYLLGIFLYEQNNLEDSKQRFLEAQKYRPGLKHKVNYNLGLIYIKQGKYQAAERELMLAANQHTDLITQRLATKALQQLNKQKGIQDTLTLKVAYFYDDNVALDPEDETIFSQKEDFGGTARLTFDQEWHLTEGLALQMDATHYQVWYQDLDEYNLTVETLKTGIQWTRGPLIFNLHYLPSYYQLDSESYLTRHTIQPAVWYKPLDNILLSLSYAYTPDNYFLDNDRDGHSNSMEFAMFYLTPKRTMLWSKISFQKKSASEPEYYYREISTQTGLKTLLPTRTWLYLTAIMTDKHYEHVDPFYGQQREDVEFQGSLSLEQAIADWLDLTLSLERTHNFSNIAVYEFRRNRATLSLTAHF